MARHKAPLFGLGGEFPGVVPLFRVSRNTTVRKACTEHSLLSTQSGSWFNTTVRKACAEHSVMSTQEWLMVSTTMDLALLKRMWVALKRAFGFKSGC